MMEVILLGDVSSKRSIFFLKAAKELEKKISLLPLEAHLEQYDKRLYIKIDPPGHQSSRLDDMSKWLDEYRTFLERLTHLDKPSFLNSPQSILDTLDKRKCKLDLEKNNIPVTPLIDDACDSKNSKELRRILKNKKIYQVFIKPRYGSGAAGVVAYRRNPRTEIEMLYTSLAYIDDGWTNTKKIQRYENRQSIDILLNRLLQEEVVVEKWVPKAVYKNYSYDLRVLWQFDHISYMVARCSKYPMTNLHLNNHVLDISALGLSEEIQKEIYKICSRAVKTIPGLEVAGIDILLSGKERKPRIIEMNAQGDLIYKDIYDKNKLYKEQIDRMSRDEKESNGST